MKPIKITVKLPDGIDLDLLEKVLRIEFEKRLIAEYIEPEVELRLNGIVSGIPTGIVDVGKANG